MSGPSTSALSPSVGFTYEGLCGGCRTLFPFRNFTVDHMVPQSKGGSDHLDNLQLLCGACNSTKGSGTQAELIAQLKADGVID